MTNFVRNFNLTEGELFTAESLIKNHGTEEVDVVI